MRGRRKRGDGARSEYLQDDRYLDAYMRLWRRNKAQELEDSKACNRVLRHIISKYEENEVVQGLFGS